ncbi:DUF512 domain-containing protein [candidate division WOR-3 bacterium]|nr:DUF512 domain-containing protein [candidate division WOR-3 bacterium]
MLLITDVEKGSIGDRAGLKPSQYILSINGERVDDALDFRFHTADEILEIEIREGEEIFRIYVEKDIDQDLGVQVKDFVIRRCQNNCIFCFMDQLPGDARKSLFVKDDDYRMSFLYGNFITLTNLVENDFKKIERLRLSPLYISVHTTNPSLRESIMRNKNAGKIKEQMMRLISSGIKLHTQIVLLPGINDGEEYLSTVEDLASMYPGVLSIGVVPVGLTAHREGLPLIISPDSDWAKEIIHISKPYQEKFREQFGITFLYLADEFYILADEEIPKREFYDDFPQIENGIGMVRRFLDGLEYMEVPQMSGRTILVTGVLAEPFVKKLEEKFKKTGQRAETVVVKNRYLGSSVTVAGLLPGWDILAMVSMIEGENIILPPYVVNSDGKFIDDFSIDDMRKFTGKRVYVAPSDITELAGVIK